MQVNSITIPPPISVGEGVRYSSLDPPVIPTTPATDARTLDMDPEAGLTTPLNPPPLQTSTPPLTPPPHIQQTGPTPPPVTYRTGPGGGRLEHHPAPKVSKRRRGPPPSVYKNNNNSVMTSVMSKLNKRKKEPKRDFNRKRGYRSSGLAPSPSWHFLLHDFTQSTTLHGIRYTTLETQFVFRRIFWWFIVGATLGIFVFYVWDRVGEYLKYKKNVNVEENYVPSMPFPSVTFCNQNSIRLTAAAENGWYGMVKKMYQEDRKEMRKCRVKDEFSCKLSECVPLTRRCDGFPDCSDESDEMGCDPCPRLLLNGTQWNGTIFNIQSNTFAVDGPAYIGRTLDAVPLKMFYNASISSWQLTDISTPGNEYASCGNTTIEFPMNNWTWLLGANKTLRFNFTCYQTDIDFPQHAAFTQKDMTALTELEVSSDDSMLMTTEAAKRTPMSTLYKNGTHEPSVFIEKCFWKGKECSPSYFKEIFTDMGKCYTFHADDAMFVESSGPGHALTLTLNIEQYEYTKNPATGVGIKVLFHEQLDEPLMSEKSVAISPGLYSLLAIEKTLIENLKPPWGNCSEWPLMYYRKYTVSTCKMECDNVFARAHCQCRNAHMPVKLKGSDSDYPICTIEQYTRCLLPKITEAKKAKEFCVCNTPCLEVVYVPSLSFAAISTDEDAIKSRQQEQQMAALQERLTKAREITYRLQPDKYRETMRTFHMIKYRSKNLINFLDVAHILFEVESGKVKALYSVIEQECKEFVTVLHQLESLIRSTLQPSMSNLQAVLQMLDFQLTDYQHVLTNTTRSVLDPNEVELLSQMGHIIDTDFINATDFSLYINENVTVNFTVPSHEVVISAIMGDFDRLSYYLLFKTRTMTVLNSMNQVQNTLLKHVNTTIANFPSIAGIQINTPNQNYTISSIKKQLLSFISLIDNKCTGIRSFIANCYSLKVKDLINNETTTFEIGKLELKTLIKDINSTIYNNIVVVMEEVKSVTSRLEPKCEYESDNLLQIYSESNRQIKSNLNYMKKDCYNFRKELDDTLERYIYTHETLSDIAARSDMNQYVADLQSKTLTIGNLLQQKIVAIRRLMAQNDIIRTKLSEYKKEFHGDKYIKQPEAGSAVSSASSSALHTPWLAMVEETQQLHLFFDRHIRNLTTVLREADKFLQSYADGNVLNENFFKKNYLQVDLFYKSLTDKKVIQQKAYEYPALLSEVGGLMGLLLGASVITIFECIDLLCYNGFVKLCERRRRPSRFQRQFKQQQHSNKPMSKNSNSLNNGTKRYNPYSIKRKGPFNVPIATFDPMDGLEYSPPGSPRHRRKILG